ncbi:phage head-tail connector protein [Croceibacterium sp. LX-88]|uniref:Phage head-tail connector protein n=1 Tax=Croceibacterium selenioxidans TaxID=2838833 RepID=A0ABS5W5T1_9SPHN|nr:phage head-tail connector protein [Croceibacterium selenioxidans]MBT2135110.1 phage head-tail connector protein [Croceibacterium selenioxidans]
MNRAIITPAALTGAALDDLKDWLGITTARDDTALEQLLRTALETCEAFTGQMPLTTLCEEVLPVSRNWQSLATTPVQSISAVEGIALDGTRQVLAPQDYALDLAPGGGALVRTLRAGPAKRVAVRFTAGMAATWHAVPDGLRHGLLRLAAHHYRQRESGATEPVPPAAVAALWRPWRRVRVA